MLNVLVLHCIVVDTCKRGIDHEAFIFDYLPTIRFWRFIRWCGCIFNQNQKTMFISSYFVHDV